MSTNNVKTRHYAALATRLRSLNQNLADSESQFQLLAGRLDAIQRLGTYHGAQFMAVSRMIDIELTEVEKKRLEEAEAGQATQMGQR
ncbi:hypothetical protein DB88DRAFT_495775 [Papiliotrema laurentii]|uniref:Uncharacterized protein n=1 Tax=Papiliotrema laurentii TaxID=5418 RepID=A0AAD9FPF5_PAPLA|nr:hypothetical protein DB88DRAFT_495775 [Papiliotrema laurentii]